MFDDNTKVEIKLKNISLSKNNMLISKVETSPSSMKNEFRLHSQEEYRDSETPTQIDAPLASSLSQLEMLQRLHKRNDQTSKTSQPSHRQPSRANAMKSKSISHITDKFSKILN